MGGEIRLTRNPARGWGQDALGSSLSVSLAGEGCVPVSVSIGS